MKITSVRVYQADLPLVDGDYCWADGKSVSVYDSTVIVITTDTGVTAGNDHQRKLILQLADFPPSLAWPGTVRSSLSAPTTWRATRPE